MKTSFTPGPWKKGKYIVVTEANKFIAHTRPISAHRVDDEANARLIAAAPELLDVLQEILQDHANCEVSTQKKAKALAAITKATGGTT